MRIEGVEVLVVGLALREPVRSAGVTHDDKTTVLARVATDDGSGWGECAAYPGARPPDPTVAAVEPASVDEGVRRLFLACPGGELASASSVLDACVGGGSIPERSVASALEMAVLDLELHASSRSLASFLGVTRDRVETGAMVGIPEGKDVARLIDAVGQEMGRGARRIRVKIEPGWDHAPLTALRERYPEAVLFADANGSFDPEMDLRALDAYGLRCLEQPFAPGDLASHRALADSMLTPIGLDESLWSAARVDEALAGRACRVACIKPGRLGGVFVALSAAAACAAVGVDCFVGGFFETGLGRAVNSALAGRGEFRLPGDLCDPDRYLEESPFTFLPTSHGEVRLSDAPGLGAEPRGAVLAARTLRRRWLPYWD